MNRQPNYNTARPHTNATTRNRNIPGVKNTNMRTGGCMNGHGDRNPSQNARMAAQQDKGSFAAPVQMNNASAPDIVRKKRPVKLTDVVRIKGGVDRPMLIIIILLLCFGTLMVFSASFAYAYDKTGDSYYYIKRQLFFCVAGLAVMFVASFMDYRWYKVASPLYFIIVGAMLVGVLMYGIAAGKAQRWITIFGQTIQPSEFMKLGLILILALYMDAFQERIRSKSFWYSSFWGSFMPFAIVGVVCLLVALEKHFSGTIIMFAIGVLVIFAGGSRKFWFIVFGVAFVVIIGIAITFVPYAQERLDIFFHPENYSALKEVWQTIQGEIAVGSGGVFGVGFGNSSQKYMYVSQPQNDFIFSIICEELGLIGALAVIVLFAALTWRGVVVAMRAPDTFSSLVVIGIVGKVAMQSILNMLVVTNMIPNTGITLPFFSYGGTALFTQLAEMGVVLSISRYTYDEK
ncbi:MAG: cell division protein FtsW [Ruminococcaceae bacterium]|nr:cell division protein FtsW [Oscillospiraceae bacterium]